MSIFEEILNSDNSVFKNQDIFSIDYLPEVIQCRDKQLKSILINIKPLLKNNKAINTIIMGNTSTGKTTVLKHALKEIEEYTNLSTCYINCNIQDTSRKCYFQIYRVLFGYEARKSVSTEIIQEEVMKKLEEESFIIAIDDINYLSNNESNKLINELFRANEFYHSNIALIITINNIFFKYELERNAQSILQGHEIEFEDYTSEEMYSILKYRCDLGFKNGVITENQIRRISNYATKYTDLRRGLAILNILGQKIESENRDHITDKDIDEIIAIS
ncbi:Cdc6/Cdc18 family protein [Candidatus Methanosphaera massiliense]|jgi:cell division control protein 6|uniref:Cdc6/Cdc18 family protein n=1 Tax=Methanosphaera TaxID=2316 RepID=UPI00238059F7|nr:AAA family ATPase [Candidatus Methanosphaera massiliense]MDD6286134.1 AAA family ATPase [Methanobacteriaceae archaeon]MDE4077701.1 AAA family ATPase [Candidatus Methanosphaera massiliense]MDY2744739.1 AAA family ATPase [Methanosphaera sp.]